MIKSKCVPVLLYGLEACALNKSQMASLDFVVNRFFMKLFNTKNIDTVKACQEFFSFELPSVQFISYHIIAYHIYLIDTTVRKHVNTS